VSSSVIVVHRFSCPKECGIFPAVIKPVSLALTSRFFFFFMLAAAAAAAAAAKSLQSCSTLCDPIDGSPPGSPIPGILQARTLEWVAISFSNARK